MVDTSKTNVLIVGASGQLGSLVTKHALKNPKLTVNILVRNPDKVKDLVDQVKAAGGNVIQGDLNNPESLTDITKGIHTVISCITVVSEKDFQAQLHVLKDAQKNGVKRFFSSHFGISYENAEPGNVLIDAKQKFNEEISKAGIKPVIITNGILLDFLLGYNAQGLKYYGDINQKIDLTTYEDVAKFAVEIAADPEKSGSFSFVGEVLSTKELVEVYNRVRGTNIQAQSAGSIEELREGTEKQKKEGNHVGAAYANIFDLVYSGKGRVTKTNNSEFPQVKTTTVEEFLKAHPDVKVA